MNAGRMRVKLKAPKYANNCTTPYDYFVRFFDIWKQFAIQFSHFKKPLNVTAILT